MSTKPQAPGPNSNPTKQARSRKAADPEPSSAGRAGSAGGVILEKEAVKKSSTPKPASTQAKDAKTQDAKQEAPKKKPRKLNKEPTPATPATKDTVPSEAAELEALKSRVRGLEAKVEQLYKTTPSTSAPRSPRRRGKARKNSSATTTATLGTLSQKKEQQPQPQEDDEEEADEELIRLESELETARQDLALYNPASSSSRPRTRRTISEDTEHVEEIPRERPGINVGADRQVTLSGSYRIPLPSTLNPQDVATIQSGVSAAQNVARSFLDQRRANQALRTAQSDAGPPPSANKPCVQKEKGNGNGQTDSQLGADAAGKQSWGEWIGGYSMAISRAVKNIEHEAAMEAQTGDARPRSVRTGSGAKGRKRPGVKTGLSREQVEGLMS